MFQSCVFTTWNDSAVETVLSTKTNKVVMLISMSTLKASIILLNERRFVDKIFENRTFRDKIKYCFYFNPSR